MGRLFYFVVFMRAKDLKTWIQLTSLITASAVISFAFTEQARGSPSLRETIFLTDIERQIVNPQARRRDTHRFTLLVLDRCQIAYSQGLVKVRQECEQSDHPFWDAARFGVRSPHLSFSIDNSKR
jgi:hypothetical protein